MKDTPLMCSTPKSWAWHILDDFDAFLLDHASCEKKAAALAMSLVVKYPDRNALIEPMVSLAREELEHFQQVFRLIQKRKLTLPEKDTPDTYINAILPHIRHGRDSRLLDRLIMSGLVEARGHERFEILAQALNSVDQSLAKFYMDLSLREAGHYKIFLRVAQVYFTDEEIDEAQTRLSLIEAQAIFDTPFGPKLH